MMHEEHHHRCRRGSSPTPWAGWDTNWVPYTARVLLWWQYSNPGKDWSGPSPHLQAAGHSLSVQGDFLSCYLAEVVGCLRKWGWTGVLLQKKDPGGVWVLVCSPASLGSWGMGHGGTCAKCPSLISTLRPDISHLLLLALVMWKMCLKRRNPAHV